jgi:hypothetical protein
LMERPPGRLTGSRLPEGTRRAILMLKTDNPDWGCQKISDVPPRGPALGASLAAVARVLHEAGYQLEETPTRPHPNHVRHFERARPNQLWQTDLFTWVREDVRCAEWDKKGLCRLVVSEGKCNVLFPKMEE